MKIKRELLSGTTRRHDGPEFKPATTSTVLQPDDCPTFDQMIAELENLPPPQIFIGTLMGMSIFVDPTVPGGEILIKAIGMDWLRCPLDTPRLKGTRLHAIAKQAYEDWHI